MLVVITKMRLVSLRGFKLFIRKTTRGRQGEALLEPLFYLDKMHYGWSWENGTIKAAGIQLTNSTLSTPRPRVIGIAQNGTLHLGSAASERQPISREVEVCQGFTNCSLTVTPLEHRRNFSPVEIRGMLDGKKRWRIRLVGKVTKVPACTCFMVQKSTFALLTGVWKFWFLIKKFPFSRCRIWILKFCYF